VRYFEIKGYSLIWSCFTILEQSPEHLKWPQSTLLKPSALSSNSSVGLGELLPKRDQ